MEFSFHCQGCVDALERSIITSHKRRLIFFSLLFSALGSNEFSCATRQAACLSFSLSFFSTLSPAAQLHTNLHSQRFFLCNITFSKARLDTKSTKSISWFNLKSGSRRLSHDYSETDLLSTIRLLHRQQQQSTIIIIIMNESRRGRDGPFLIRNNINTMNASSATTYIHRTQTLDLTLHGCLFWLL